MADTTKIEWTDATWNPITGCTLVSDGCRNCYAAQLAATRLKNHPSRAGLARRNADGVAKFTGEVRFNEDWLDQPLRWKKPRRIFVCAHGDLFHENVPDEWIDRVFSVMALCRQHEFQVLTKRPERARDYFTAKPGGVPTIGSTSLAHVRVEHSALTLFAEIVAKDTTPLNRKPRQTFDAEAVEVRYWPLPNVWLGTSIEDQTTADARIPHLLATPAAVRFVSAEPLLGPVDFNVLSIDEHEWVDGYTGWRYRDLGDASGNVEILTEQDCGLDWIIVGGESGPRARDMNPAWSRALRDQCHDAGVAFFMKQMARKADIPSDLQIREFPA